MKYKILLAVSIVLIVGAAGYLFYNFKKTPAQNIVPQSILDGAENATYIIEGIPTKFTYSDSKSEVGSRIYTAHFFQSITGDLNNDGAPDAGIIIVQDNGGSGSFYYAAVAINTPQGAVGTNAVFLGDRIAPQGMEIKDGQLIVNYAERKPGEPMTTPPSVGVSAYLVLENGVLKNTKATPRVITYLISEADTTKYCNGADMDSEGYRKTITTEKTVIMLEVNPTKERIARTVIKGATTGMCQRVMEQINITESNGVVNIYPIEGWAGMSIAMCSCKPEVEVNLLRLPGITDVVWSEPQFSNFEECAAAGNPIMESYPRQCKQGEKTFVEYIGNELEKTDLIRLNSPRPNQTINSPVLVTGQARGVWFFEASFPVFLTDWDGKIIAQGIAQARTDWMTNEFVPFEAKLTFTVDKNIYSNKGTLILRKDNPSGLPEHDDALEIPVVLGF